MENQSIAKNLVYHRKKRGYSQAELSEMTNVTIRTIQRIEKEEVNPHLKTVKLLAAALDVEVDGLLVLDDPKEETIQKKWLLLLHGTPVLGLTIPLCNILIPLFLWIHKREDNPVYDRHGRAIVNFHITMTILFALAFVALVTVQGYGFFFFIAVAPYTIIVTLINIIAALNSQKCYYPLAIPFLKAKKSTVSKAMVILFISCLFNFTESDPVSSQPISQSGTTGLQVKGFSAELDSLCKAHHIPGLAVAIIKNKKLPGPAGMNRTMSSQWQHKKAGVFFDMAQGYQYKNGSYIKRMRPDRHLAGGAGIVSTVDDLAKYDIVLDTGKLASDSVMEKLFTPAVAPDGTTLPYAFGWYVQEYNGEKLIWHSGWDPEAGKS